MATFEKRITIGANDGFSRGSGVFSTTENSILMGDTGGFGIEYSPFLLFTSFDIPVGSTITAAYIQITCNDFASTGTFVDSDLYGNLSVSPSAPTSQAEFAAKVRTSAKVDWQPGDWSLDEQVNTPSLITIVQEIVDQDGYGPGNSIQFFFDEGSSASVSTRSFYSFEGSATKAALLHVEYTPPVTPIFQRVEPLEFYLIPHVPDTVFTGVVSTTPSDPYINIAYNTGITGSFGEPIAGQSVWFGTTSGGKERGILRLREKTGTTTGNIKVAESDDVGPSIQAGDFITVKNDFRLWPKYPRFIQSGANVTIFEDYDIPYTNQTSQWRPIAVAGPPGVAFIEAGQAQVSFVGDKSFALADGATISSYLWTAMFSSEGTSSSQGTEASPVVFTWTTPGWHLVSLKITDSNGQTHTNYTWAVIIDPDSPEDVAFLDFDPISDSFDFEQGGGESSFVVRGDISISEFAEEAMILHVARGNQTTATGYWPFRTNLLFSGWILSDTVRQNPEQGDVSFRAGTIDVIMKNLSMFPASLLNLVTPTIWSEVKDLNVDRAASFLWEWRSTLSIMTSIVRSKYSGLIRRQDFGPSDLYAQLNNELMASIWGKVIASSQSVLYHSIDYNLQNATERASVTTRKLLHKGIWVNDVNVEEISNYEWQAKQVKMSGIFYPGGEVDDICPLFSEAPGDAPKVYGKELNFDRLILLSQSDLNVRCGHALAQANEQYPIYRMSFINDGSFNIAPQELFPAVIESGDNDRQLSLSPNLIPRRMSRAYDHAAGVFIIQVDFEPEVTGVPGLTVNLPCGPPEQKLPSGQEPRVPTIRSSDIEGQSALIIGTTGTSFYYAPGIEQAWERRVQGLIDPDQLAFKDVIKDPWSTFKQGYNPDNVIVWGSGLGFLSRSKNSGRNWNDRTAYLSQPNGNPSWPNETGTAITSQSIIRLQADIFNEDRLYALASWQYTGSAWHGAIAKSTDGFDFNWFNITGSSQIRPLGMSMDNGNGQSLYITTWENVGTGTLYLNRFNISDMSLADKISLGEVSASDMDAQSFFAHPFNRNNQANEIYIFGRMNAPQGFTGTVHILKSISGGATGSWSVIENTWGTDKCGSFGADIDENYYAVRQE